MFDVVYFRCHSSRANYHEMGIFPICNQSVSETRGNSLSIYAACLNSAKCIKIHRIALNHRMLLCVISSSLNVSMLLHACMCICVCLPVSVCLACGSRGGLLQKRIWGYMSPVLLWCTGFQGAMIIHCVKTNLRKIRCTDCIQGNRIEAALTVFHSPRHDNMIFGLLHYRKCHPGPLGKAAGTQYGNRVFELSVLFLFDLLSLLTNKLSSGTVMLIAVLKSSLVMFSSCWENVE